MNVNKVIDYILNVYDAETNFNADFLKTSLNLLVAVAKLEDHQASHDAVVADQEKIMEYLRVLG